MVIPSNITNTLIIGISEAKLNETILSSELGVDGYDLVRLDRSRRGQIAYSYEDSYIEHPINQILLSTLMMFSQNLGF